MDLDKAKEDAEQFNDYLVTFHVEKFFEGEKIIDKEITLRVAGVGLGPAIDGAKHGLEQAFTEVEAVSARNDHTDEDIEPPFWKYDDPLDENNQ